MLVGSDCLIGEAMKNRSNERTWRSLALMNFGVLILVLVGGFSGGQDKIRVNEIELVNDDGVVVGSWKATDKGSVLSMEASGKEGKILLRADSPRPSLKLDNPDQGGQVSLSADESAMFVLGNVSKGGYMMFVPHVTGSYFRIFSHDKKRAVRIETGVVPGARIWLGTTDKQGFVGAEIAAGQGVVRWLEHSSKPAKLPPPTEGGR